MGTRGGGDSLGLCYYVFLVKSYESFPAVSYGWLSQEAHRGAAAEKRNQWLGQRFSVVSALLPMGHSAVSKV